MLQNLAIFRFASQALVAASDVALGYVLKTDGLDSGFLIYYASVCLLVAALPFVVNLNS
ncbi:MAG: hypothetical protein V3V35_10845 [Dehalococcoidia bacterium]